tara:strand:- start:136 stop:369 length:234 start_codon:yes stop_codon:yes gene_type:complete
MSSKGDPGGNSKGNGFVVDFIVCVVEIFTTEGISFSAKSAKESGTVLLKDDTEKKFNITRIRLMLINFLFNIFYLTL